MRFWDRIFDVCKNNRKDAKTEVFVFSYSFGKIQFWYGQRKSKEAIHQKL
jgi:hypothetical protein